MSRKQSESKPAVKRTRTMESRSRATGAPARQRSAAKDKRVEKSTKPDVSETETAYDQRDPSDLARDENLRKKLEDENARSPGDRHRERLTAIEAEEDNAPDDDDDDSEEKLREQALNEQNVEYPEPDRP